MRNRASKANVSFVCFRLDLRCCHCPARIRAQPRIQALTPSQPARDHFAPCNNLRSPFGNTLVYGLPSLLSPTRAISPSLFHNRLLTRYTHPTPSFKSPSPKMPALDYSLIARRASSPLAKREITWPRENAGVMVVFCIVFVVGVGLLALFISRKMAARKARKPVT